MWVSLRVVEQGCIFAAPGLAEQSAHFASACRRPSYKRAVGSDRQRESRSDDGISAVSCAEFGASTGNGPYLKEIPMGRGILLWMLGVPLPVILLLAMCSHH
jgi:hypothetical protein